MCEYEGGGGRREREKTFSDKRRRNLEKSLLNEKQDVANRECGTKEYLKREKYAKTKIIKPKSGIW